jgi:DNA modification methylase
MGKNARTFGQDLMRGEGRQKNGLTWTGAAVEFDHYRVKEGARSSTKVSGTSIFDPVLCELVYRWFCPAGGAVLDPFAGGSVRGIVASKLGLHYTGIDLSERQIIENRKQAAEICTANHPTWILGDSRNACSLAAGEYDLIFSCPPYGDLEVYSDDERDLSTLDYPDFLAAYREIIGTCAAMLKPGRFACFVVGDFRDRQGFYRNFVSETIAAFESAGLRLYNEAVLVTAVGSLPIRIGKQFGRYRKLGKTHQNVLVFYNGQPKAISDVLGVCEFGEIDQEGDDKVS